MTTTSRAFGLLFVCGCATAWAGSALGADELGDEQKSEAPWHEMSRQVLVKNSDLSTEVIDMVSAAANSDPSDADGEDDSPKYFWSLRRPGSRLSPQAEIFTLDVNWQGGKDGAEQSSRAWATAREQAEAALRGVQATVMDSRVEELNRQRSKLAAQIDVYRHELAELREKLNALAGPYSEQFTRIQFDAAASMLQKLTLERVGVAARREAIEDRIDELRKLDEEGAKDDPVNAELRKLVAIREEQLANVKALFEVGQAAASSQDMRDAQAGVAHARIDLLRAERETSETANGPVLRELNNELSKLIVRDAELKAMRDAVEKQTRELEDRLRSADERSLLTQQAEGLRSLIGVTEGRIRDLENEADQSQGPITIQPLSDSLQKPKR